MISLNLSAALQTSEQKRWLVLVFSIHTFQTPDPCTAVTPPKYSYLKIHCKLPPPPNLFFLGGDIGVSFPPFVSPFSKVPINPCSFRPDLNPEPSLKDVSNFVATVDLQ